jgi:broad specificity phosphatase PhoE
MIKIIFETHATSLDNEAGISSGANDTLLSETGKKQALQLGARYKHTSFDAIFCSTLSRSYQTAEIAFSDRNFLIHQDARLNECNYGRLNGHPASIVEPKRRKHITTPFPEGESYTDTCERMHSFLQDLAISYQNKSVMIIGHRATQYGLEHWLKGQSIEEAATSDWSWQPGWEYVLAPT